MQKFNYNGVSNGVSYLIRQARERSMGGDHVAAIEYLKKAVDLEPQHPEVFALMGDCCDYLGQYEQAIAHYDRALVLDPYHADAWFNKGMTLRSMDRNTEAIRCIEKSIELYCSH